MAPDESCLMLKSLGLLVNLLVLVSSFVSIFFYFWVCLLADLFLHSCACCFFLSFSIVSSLFLCAFVCCVGRTTSRQVEGCLLLQNTMAFWEWDKAPPPPIKPPKKSFSACCLVCGGLPLYDLKHSLHALNKLLPDDRSPSFLRALPLRHTVTFELCCTQSCPWMFPHAGVWVVSAYRPSHSAIINPTTKTKILCFIINPLKPSWSCFSVKKVFKCLSWSLCVEVHAGGP